MMRNDGGTTVTPPSIECVEKIPERVVKLDEVLDVAIESSIEHLKVLLRSEAVKYPLCKDYLSSPQEYSVDSTDRVSEAWRRKLCEWCYEVVDHFSFDREVVSYALDFLDRSVAAKTDSLKAALPKREFQLMAVTSLYTAIKLHGETDEKEGPRRKLRIGAFVELSRGFFAVDVIEQSEREILEALQWRVNPPTSLRFITTMLRTCPKWSSNESHISFSQTMSGLYEIARYLTELAVCTSIVSFSCKTSVVAYAAILCALDTMKAPLTMPDGARAGFLKAMATTTGLCPSDPNVIQAVALLKGLCPDMFSCINVLPDIMEDSDSDSSRYVRRSGSFDDRDSPVCVVDTHEHDASPSSPRKRRCPSTDDSCRNGHHRSSFL